MGVNKLNAHFFQEFFSPQSTQRSQRKAQRIKNFLCVTSSVISVYSVVNFKLLNIAQQNLRNHRHPGNQYKSCKKRNPETRPKDFPELFLGEHFTRYNNMNNQNNTKPEKGRRSPCIFPCLRRESDRRIDQYSVTEGYSTHHISYKGPFLYHSPILSPKTASSN